MNKFFYIAISLALFAGCKGGEKTTSAAAKSNLSDSQKAEVTYAFFNANKEKILGNYDNAATQFSDVIRKDPSNAAAMYELANIYSRQKKYADALYFAKGAYQLDKKNNWYVLSYVDVLEKNKKFTEAGAVLKKQCKTILPMLITTTNGQLRVSMQRNPTMPLKYMIN